MSAKSAVPNGAPNNVTTNQVTDGETTRETCTSQNGTSSSVQKNLHSDLNANCDNPCVAQGFVGASDHSCDTNSDQDQNGHSVVAEENGLSRRKRRLSDIENSQCDDCKHKISKAEMPQGIKMCCELLK